MPKAEYSRARVNGSNQYQHRTAVAKALGRALGKDTVVDHKDGNKSNNSAGNLKAMSRADHARKHHAVYKTTQKCAVCGKSYTPPADHRGRNQTCSKACANKLLSRKARQR